MSTINIRYGERGYSDEFTDAILTIIHRGVEVHQDGRRVALYINTPLRIRFEESESEAALRRVGGGR